MKIKFLMKSFVFIILGFQYFWGAGSDQWQTYYEKSGYKRTPRYRETINFCQRLAESSSWVQLTYFGKSAQNRNLPLLIVDKDGCFSPESTRASGKIVLLIQAGIHAGEIDGKDAGLMLIRDIVIHKKATHLLDNVTLLFIPIFNVDGHERFGPYNRVNQNGPEEMGWRVTAQNLNLNRDFLKADTPEMQAWLRLFNQWIPDLLVDCHVTDGADYQYVITYGIETQANVAKPLRCFSSRLVEPFLNRAMNQDGILMNFYVQFREWSNPESGLMASTYSPRYSTGYGVVQNRLFYLIETHMLKNYKTRVTATYHLLKNILKLANQYKDEIRNVNFESDRLTADNLIGEYLPIRLRTSFEDSVLVDFLGVEFEKVSSKISGSERIIYHSDRPRTYRLPYFNKVVVTDSVLVPFAYLVPQEWQIQIDRLRLHGVKIHRLTKDTTLQVNSYRFKNVRWAPQPYEGRHRVQFDLEQIEEYRNYREGDAVIFLNQRTNRVIVHLLEPKAPDSFISWGFWDAIFERKEYAEKYVLEALAEKMLKKYPDLRKDFEQKLSSDSVFTASPRMRLDYFYQHSPYRDKKRNVYPVGRLMSSIKLPVRLQKESVKMN